MKLTGLPMKLSGLRIFQSRKADGATEGASQWLKVVLFIIAILLVIMLIKIFLPNPSEVIMRIKQALGGAR